MADKKISQLTSATTPLAGTEVLPIVQSGSTVKVSIDNVTKGRTVNATTFDTDVAAAGVTLSGTTLAADGTDTNISINVTPKGSGSLATTKLSATGDVSFDGGAFVFNESGANKDFRVEGDGSAYLLYTKASTDQVGLNTSAPIRLLTLGGGNDLLFLNNAGDGATNTVLGRVSSNVRSYGGNIGTASFATMEFATDATDWFKGEIRFLTNSTDGTDGAGTTRMKIGANGNITVSTGNLVVGTAAKGIDFSANTHAAGMTSELLNWYEEGTWTPTDASGAGLTFAQANGSYTRIGRQVTAWGFVTYPGTASANGVEIGGLPFTSANVDAVRGGGMIGFCDASTVSSVLTNKNGTAVKLYDSSGVQIVNSTMNNKSIYYAVTYFV